jgi:hypothetical protein
VWRQAEQTVVQYMTSLVFQLGLSADPAALAHTLESELGITTMVELTAAAEQLPYVLDDSFPKEILDVLIPKPPWPRSTQEVSAAISVAMAAEERLRSQQEAAELAVTAVGERLRLHREAAEAAEVEQEAAQAVVERLRTEREAAQLTVEQLRAEQAAVEAAAAVAAAAERLRLEEEVAYHTQRLEAAGGGGCVPHAEARGGASSARHQRRCGAPTCRSAGRRGRGAVRGVCGRSQGSPHAAVWAFVCVRGVRRS